MGPTIARRYRIYIGYTDDLLDSPDRLIALATNLILNAGIENFTRHINVGFWNGKHETSCTFEIISSAPYIGLRVQQIAAMLKEMPEGPQETVLLTVEPTETYLI